MQRKKETYCLVNGRALKMYVCFSLQGLILVLAGAYSGMPWLAVLGAVGLCAAIIVNVRHADMLHVVVFGEQGVELRAGKQPLLYFPWEQIADVKIDAPHRRYRRVCLRANWEKIAFLCPQKQYGHIQHILVDNDIQIFT